MSVKNSIEKMKLQNIANCKPTAFASLQVALFNDAPVSFQVRQMQDLQ
jgi:hypothetical protein